MNLKALEQQMRDADDTEFKPHYYYKKDEDGTVTRKTYSPRLTTLAKFINEKFPDLEAELRSTGNVYKDRQLTGTRLRSPGIREYKGNILKVKDKKTNGIIFDHDSTDTYRNNVEVCRWILNKIDKTGGG